MDARSGLGRRAGPRLAAPLARRRSALDREGDALARSHGLDRGSAGSVPARATTTTSPRVAREVGLAPSSRRRDRPRARTFASRSPATPTRPRARTASRRSTRFQVYARMAAEANDFNINLGDTIYSDSEVGGAPVARTVAREVGEVPARARASRARVAPSRRPASTATGTTTSSSTTSLAPSTASAIYAAGVKAFTDYAPVAKPSANGLYRTFRWGKNLELFFLDERSFRSAKAASGVRRRPRSHGAAGGARCVRDPRARSDEPGARRHVSPRSTTRRGRCSARVSTRRSRKRSRRRRRRGRSSSTRCRSSSSTRCRTTAGRDTRPSASGSSASCRRT